MTAILFGSISTIADTSELQREAFNRAFTEHGLDWRWDRDDYAGMLRASGGAARIAEYAQARGQQVDAAAVHATKSEHFRQSMAGGQLRPRPGVVDTIRAAREDGLKVGLVSTTEPANVEALLRALGPELGEFDVLVDSSRVEHVKPAADAYSVALRELAEDPAACVAVEDNEDGVKAAVAAGLRCVAFPNENTAGHAFDAADRRTEQLSLAELRQLVSD